VESVNIAFGTSILDVAILNLDYQYFLGHSIGNSQSVNLWTMGPYDMFMSTYRRLIKYATYYFDRKVNVNGNKVENSVLLGCNAVFLLNTDIYLRVYTASQPRSTTSSSLSP
jgi:hypothetical protein